MDCHSFPSVALPCVLDTTLGWPDFCVGTDAFHTPGWLVERAVSLLDWGYVLEGKVSVTYGSGDSETVSGGDLFYWPPGHTVKVDETAELILFSPRHEHGQVIDHILQKLGA